MLPLHTPMLQGVSVLADIRDLIAKGEYLLACDVTRTQIESGRADLEIRYLHVLALARSGATSRAVAEFDALGLSELSTPFDDRLGVDVAALRARLAKDQALEGGVINPVLAAFAARAYEAIFASSGSTYPGVNAATMWLVAGETDRARQMASAVLASIDSHRGTGGTYEDGSDSLDAYWSAATEAEAALVVGDHSRVTDAVARALEINPADLSARASTYRQLRMVCIANEADLSLIEPLQNRMIIHFCGHRMSETDLTGRFRPGQEEATTRAVTDAIAELNPMAGYGSLASGADTIIAEALLDTGAELHIWLPFERDEFIATSVAPAGQDWVERFERCESMATTIETAVSGTSMSDPTLFDYCSRLAMGDVLIRGRNLSSPVHQIAIWDGQPTAEVAGTSVDVARWAEAGHESIVIPVAAIPALNLPASDRAASRHRVGEWGNDAVPDEPRNRRSEASDHKAGSVESSAAIRVIRALVFADVAGYSQLGDAEVSTFDAQVLTRVGATVDSYAEQVLLRETWGDGIYLVFDAVTAAADCALAIQETFAQIDLGAIGLEALRGLRVGMHVGPVLQGWDSVAHRRRFSGSHVTHAARIEPRTPEGAVYVTRQFAAAVALEAPDRFSCEYVGQVPAVKDYGIVPMYVLARTGVL